MTTMARRIFAGETDLQPNFHRMVRPLDQPILGTRRGFRRIGLGRAMLLAGLRQLKADGMATAKLGGDADGPTGATRLYESAGFRVLRTSVSYKKDL